MVLGRMLVWSIHIPPFCNVKCSCNWHSAVLFLRENSWGCRLVRLPRGCWWAQREARAAGQHCRPRGALWQSSR